eukprot:gene4024-14103_t
MATYPRNKKVMVCPVFWCYMYLLMEEIVNSNGLQKDIATQDYWDHLLFHREGNLIKRLDARVHIQSVRRAQAATDNCYVKATHHPRRSGPARDATEFDMSSEAQQQMGTWALSTLGTLYGKLIRSSAAAQAAGFLTRADVYLPRNDLFPTDFYNWRRQAMRRWPGFKAMTEDWPFAQASRLVSDFAATEPCSNLWPYKWADGFPRLTGRCWTSRRGASKRRTVEEHTRSIEALVRHRMEMGEQQAQAQAEHPLPMGQVAAAPMAFADQQQGQPMGLAHAPQPMGQVAAAPMAFAGLQPVQQGQPMG